MPSRKVSSTGRNRNAQGNVGRALRSGFLLLALICTAVLIVHFNRPQRVQRSEKTALESPATAVPTRVTMPLSLPQKAIPATPQGKRLAEPSSEPAAAARLHEQFTNWTTEYLQADAATQGVLEFDGVELAAQRRDALRALIAEDPEAALSLAVPFHLRDALPPAIVEFLETPVEGRGDYLVIAARPSHANSTFPLLQRRVEMQGMNYDAFVFGRRLRQPSKLNVSLHGIAIDSRLALHESPVRLLSNAEAALRQVNPLCPLDHVPAAGPVISVGGEAYRTCDEQHAIRLAHTFASGDGAINPYPGTTAMADTMPPQWTTGPKRILVLRAAFSDDAQEWLTATGASNLLQEVNRFFARNSYGHASLEPVFTPLLRLPETKGWYAQHDPYRLRADALAAAREKGFDPDAYPLDCLFFEPVFLDWSGLAYVGMKGVWLQTNNPIIASHELGHNFGLFHANSWMTSDDSVAGAGENIEYGDLFDTMGLTDEPYDFNTCSKWILGWLSTNATCMVASNGVYQLDPFDVPQIQPGQKYALLVPRDAERAYWLELRQVVPQDLNSARLFVRWNPWSQSNGGTHLLDSTPGSASNFYDAGLALGNTLRDSEAGIEITPLRLLSSGALEVRVNIAPETATNRVPEILRLVRTTANAEVTLWFRGAPHRPYALWANPDSRSTGWQPLATNSTDAQGLGEFHENTAGVARRFYRIVAPETGN